MSVLCMAVLDRVGRTQMHPVLRRVIVEGEQHLLLGGDLL